MVVLKLRRRWPLVALGVLVLLAAVSGTALGYSLRLGLPSVSSLEDYAPPVTTPVLARNGAVVDTFAEQKRVLIEHRDIPQVFVQALVAVEDSRFRRHTGIDFQGIMRAAWHNISRFQFRNPHGASTLTQQLARNLFLHPGKTVRRKLQEMVLALEIERHYTKQEILRFYCNQVYMGHGYYGLQAAARFYLGKPARELDLAEAALLAGLIQRPEDISPFKNPERAGRRRNHVLSRMALEGYITPEQAAQASKTPVPRNVRRRSRELAPYFVEEVRRWLQREFGSSSIYRAGYDVRTTLDPRLQEIANAAVDHGLRELDKRQGWRGPAGRVPQGADPGAWNPPSWEQNGISVGAVADGVVSEVEPGRAIVRVGELAGELGPEQVKWTGEKDPVALLKPGDLVRVRIRSAGADGSAALTLEQVPLVEAALVALDPASGAVRALVGGFDFNRSEYDRAVQAKRQTGSAFKPFVFAAALAEGWTLADTLLDAPTVFLDPQQPQPYLPRNYTEGYYGTVTLRRALEKSANVATVRLLNEVGPRAVIDTARRLGISSDLQPYPSLALGSFELSLLELTSAYGTFANHGVRVEPHLVEEVRDRRGAVLYRVEPQVADALSPQVAHLLNRMLEGVITDGTGKAAARLGLPLAGKTGTTDDNTDAWFIGYSPDLALGVWVGFDTKTSLGSRETGALAALPIWRQFMKQAHEAVPTRDFDKASGVTVVVIDRETGLRANPSANCKNLFSETFVSGTEPTEYCSKAHHQWLELPYPLQRYPIVDGELTIREAELDELLANEPGVVLADWATRLEIFTEDRIVSMPLQVEPGGGPEPLPAWIVEQLVEQEADPRTWVGTDGRKAEVYLFRRPPPGTRPRSYYFPPPGPATEVDPTQSALPTALDLRD